ncbi:hypothetical protein Lal_00021787 [Lupinus albus]|uniref:Uncharacterized protein n=1 Tax=Lupinus albus TaxID=3870 RepID=A0A6A4NBF8_LUPAL|nr:hypothetical protein Lalb_Chr25g0280121 [Lupinus albus]KAF1865786.1 hypothetical protein Lal_00021787 [Lupinus albus]
MAPNGDSLPRSDFCKNNNMSKPAKLSSENLQRTISDISFDLTNTKEVIDDLKLAPISEVEDAKCECCGMCEECTQEYINLICDKFFGKFVCGLCSEAVKEELVKNGGKKEDALSAHITACVSFNKYGRAFPVLFQAQAMKEILKKNTQNGRIRAKSFSPGDKEGVKKGLISRSSSCISAFTKELNDIKIAH